MEQQRREKEILMTMNDDAMENEENNKKNYLKPKVIRWFYCTWKWEKKEF